LKAIGIVGNSLKVLDHSHLDAKVLKDQNDDFHLTKFCTILVKILISFNEHLEKIYNKNTTFPELKVILNDTQKETKYIKTFLIFE